MHRSAFFLLFVGALAPACSSSDFQVASDAASTDSASTDGATGSDTTTGDTTVGCIVPPAATGSEGDFCQAFADYESRCGHCEACVQQNANNCIAFGQGISDVLKRAFVSCHDSLSCAGQFADWVKDPCVGAQLAAGSLSEKQKHAKDAYCAACPSNKNECDHFFDLGGDAGVGGGVDGIGAYVVFGNDDAVQKMIDGCSGATDCSPSTYVLCTAIQFCGPVPTDACGSKFCK